jgi:hypothetical protein
VTSRSAYAPPPTMPITGCPMLTCCTRDPIDATVPANSIPGISSSAGGPG